MVRRKNYFIKKRFQMSFAFRFLALLFIESLFILQLFMYIANNTITVGYANSSLQISKTSSFFWAPFTLITLIIVFGVSLVGTIVFIFLSHRIAGPLYRFEKTLKEMESGDLTLRVDLRRTDQLIELKEAFNALIISLDKKISSIKNEIDEAHKLLAKNDDPHIVSKLNKAVEILKKEVDYFKVSSETKE